MGVTLLDTPVDHHSVVHDISANGLVIVGDIQDVTGSINFPVQWTSVGATALPLPLGSDYATANGVSADGRIIVGMVGSSAANMYNTIVRWSETGGVQVLGVPPGSVSAIARNANQDGSLVAIQSWEPAGSSFTNRAYLWSGDLGLMDLRVFLASRGADVSEWMFASARISADGRSMAGRGFHSGLERAFVVSGIVICPGDASGDGVVNFVDLNLVLSQFGQSGLGLSGDINADGVVNFPDLNFVLSAFGQSC